MQAWVIRPERLGRPGRRDAARDRSTCPMPGPGEVLVRVMAAGVNYNGVWASLGLPVSIFRYTGYDFHIARLGRLGHRRARSGPGVTRWKAGDEVVIHCNQSCGECAGVQRARPDGVLAAEDLGLRVELGLVRRVLPGAGPAAAAQAGTADLGGGRVATGSTYFTAYRMLVDQADIKAGDNVLVWGAGGGLGIVRGAAVQALRRQRDRRRLVATTRPSSCAALGATAVIDRREFALNDPDTGERNLDEIKRFGKAIREATGGDDVRHRLRARRRGDVLHQRVRLQDVRQDRDLRRDLGLLARLRRALPVDAPEDDHRQPLRQRLRVPPREPADRRGQDRAGAVAHVPVRRVPGAAPDDEGERSTSGRWSCWSAPSARARGGRRGSRPAVLRARRRRRATYDDDIGDPGRTRSRAGIHRDMYRGRPWSIRQYAGFGTAEETNRRFRFLIDQGQAALSTAFDLPTQMGLDSDDPRALGEVGRVGVAIDSLADMEAMFDGIPLDAVSTSMTINAPAAVLVAMYARGRRAAGRATASQIRGTAQNDVLKEYVARGTYIYPPRPSPAAGGRPDRLVRARRAALQRDLALRLPHARGGLHGGAGDGVRARPTRSPTSRRWSSAGVGRRRVRARGSRGSSTRT